MLTMTGAAPSQPPIETPPPKAAAVPIEHAVARSTEPMSIEHAEARSIDVTIERVDAGTLDPAIAEQMAEVANAANAADGLDFLPTPGPSLVALARYTSANRPLDALWLARLSSQDVNGGCADPSDGARPRNDADGDRGRPGRPDDKLAGWAYLELPKWDNTHMAYVSCFVHPDDQRKGIGTAMLESQIAASQEAGRSLLLTFGPRESSRIKFLLANGFEVAQVSAQRRLEPHRIDYSRIEAIASDAASAAKDYELVELDGSTPEPMMAAMRTLSEAINDAPLDDADLEPDVFPAERVRSYETAMAARRQHVYRLLARHRRTGELVGLTILCVDELRPGLAHQEDTSVVRAHRGHRLGLLLKTRMLLWMRDRHPELTRIDTYNATSNDHMIRVNEELGARYTSESCLLQRHLT